MRLRLWHAADGTRVAYREAGAGPPLVLLHSALLTHREWEPAVEHLTHRFRVVLPDLPLHGDSEDHPRHSYSLPWFADVMSAFCEATAGPRPLVGGEGMGAEVLLHAATTGRLRPARLVLATSRLHAADAPEGRRERAWRVVARAGAMPGGDRALARVASAAFPPRWGEELSARGNPAARDLVRHAFADTAGNANRARAWARHARGWPPADPGLLDAYARLDHPVLLLWGDADPHRPVSIAEAALARLPDGQLRVLPGAGRLLAYDDPVGTARELLAFCA